MRAEAGRATLTLTVEVVDLGKERRATARLEAAEKAGHEAAFQEEYVSADKESEQF